MIEKQYLKISQFLILRILELVTHVIQIFQKVG